MLDFVKIATKSTKRGCIEIYPKFIIGKSKDLMIRGGDFYAVYVEELGLWSTDEQDVINIIDSYLDEYYEQNKRNLEGNLVTISYMWDSESGTIDAWHKYVQKQCRDNYKPLDTTICFNNSTPKKEDYCSKRLEYSLEDGPIDNFKELLYSLYAEEEAAKILWSIGCVVSGDSKKTEKFLVLYGLPGTGKGTILQVVEKLFKGYTAVFDAKSLGSASSEFALEAFKTNPLVAIQYDGDLSKIENNARLNSLISHETMTVNEKHKSLYAMSYNSFLFLGTNKPVKITDNKSGIIRRLIDVSPLGVKIPKHRYLELMKGINFELGHIAKFCLDLYLNNKDMYDDYKPTGMMGESNDFYNYMLDSYIVFSQENGTSLKTAWEMYKTYNEEAQVKYPLNMREFKSELGTYFEHYIDRIKVEDTWIRSYFSGFKTSIFEQGTRVLNLEPVKQEEILGTLDTWLSFEDSDYSILDDYCKDCQAQYASQYETPCKPWADVTTTLKDIDPTQLHYLRVPENLIIVDFDLKDDEGKKSFELNMKAASEWPKTYAELSKSGGGIHLHYIYNGDVSRLCREYSDNIEIKVFSGNSSLRRKLTKCTMDDIATISSGLPLKKEGYKVIKDIDIKNEKSIRTMIAKNLNKEYHGATKPSMDFIYKILEDAFNSGIKYDVTDMHNAVLAFAASSTNQSDYCMRLVPKMHFKSEDGVVEPDTDTKDIPIVFYDVEVFPNLFLINWKYEGAGKTIFRMINPTPADVESLIKKRLVGFNCRRYDNHILYARLIGYSNEELYKLSKKIIGGIDKNCFFSEAYNISYTDIYDYASKKQSLKKWEIELGIHHQELGMDWDKPVPEEMWDEVAAYCDNDVISTEAVWNATKDDFLAREILADIAGMSVNTTTNTLTTKLIFGSDKTPDLVYTNLEETFPGYTFVKEWNPQTQKFDMHNMYRGVDLGFGGYVDSEPSMAGNVALLDVMSLHPHSIIAMNMFGKYTKNFEDLVNVRVFVKHKKFEEAKLLFGGKLEKYLTDKSSAKKLSKALKIAINSVYGLTSAKFDNPFKDIRNENNIVALRGALFMKTLEDEVKERGFKVMHIKTDSIKIPDATLDIINFCMDFAKKYGYTFEHEALYDRICLVNDAVYIAKYATKEQAIDLYGENYIMSSDDILSANKEHWDKGDTLWTATGTQFAVPYVFKKCFSHEPFVFGDFCETKEVKNTSIFLDMNEGIDTTYQQEIEDTLTIRSSHYSAEDIGFSTKRANYLTQKYSQYTDDQLLDMVNGMHKLQFIGRIGLFVPVLPGSGGGLLVREAKTTSGKIKYDSVVGTKGYRWLEAEYVVDNNMQDCVDTSYYENLVDEAIKTISQFGDYDWFVSDEPYPGCWYNANGVPDYNVTFAQI